MPHNVNSAAFAIEIDVMLTHVLKRMTIKDDIADISRDMATKDQLVALHVQVNAIEQQMRRGKYEQRLGDREQDVFGDARI